MTRRSHYTFGDGSVAELRLRRLAALFAAPSAALLRSLAPPPPARILDLGCGPGFTTALLAEIFPEAQCVVGIEASERFATTAAREHGTSRIRFERHDATAAPLPGAPFDLINVRFLLTHLADPIGAMRAWRDAAAPRGRLVSEELASLTSQDSLVQRYYDIVAAMQRHYGQRFDIGRSLDAIATAAGWSVVRFEVCRLDIDVRGLLELHALNVRSWRADPYVQSSCDPSELEAIERRLDEVARGGAPAPPVEYVLGQLVAAIDPG